MSALPNGPSFSHMGIYVRDVARANDITGFRLEFEKAFKRTILDNEEANRDLYERLFNDANPAKLDFAAALNPASLTVCHGIVEGAQLVVVHRHGHRVSRTKGEKGESADPGRPASGSVRGRWQPCCSSRTRTPGSPSSAAASWSLWRIPRLKPPTVRPADSVRPTSASV
mgnify:CR=1 FL=1